MYIQHRPVNVHMVEVILLNDSCNQKLCGKMFVEVIYHGESLTDGYNSV